MIRRLLLVMAVVAIASGMATGSAVAATLMNIAYATSENNPYGTFMNTFADRFNKLTGGEVRVKVHCCFKMGGEQDMFKKLQLGTLDGTLIAQNNAGPFYPKIDLLVLPYMLQNLEHAYKVVDGDVGKKIWGAMPEGSRRPSGQDRTRLVPPYLQFQASHQQHRGFQATEVPRAEERCHGRYLQGFRFRPGSNGLVRNPDRCTDRYG